jgi:hypothetical protein
MTILVWAVVTRRTPKVKEEKKKVPYVFDQGIKSSRRRFSFFFFLSWNKRDSRITCRRVKNKKNNTQLALYCHLLTVFPTPPRCVCYKMKEMCLNASREILFFVFCFFLFDVTGRRKRKINKKINLPICLTNQFAFKGELFSV